MPILYTWPSERSQKISLQAASWNISLWPFTFVSCGDCLRDQMTVENTKQREKSGRECDFEVWCFEARFKRLKLNWFTHKNWIEYQVKCQIQEKNYKPVNTIIIQKNSNGFHSKELSVSHFGFFTSAKEQKWKPHEGSVSLWVFIWQRGKPGTCRSMWITDAFKTHRKNYQD